MANQVHRIGGFVAFNTGRIEDCYSQVRMKAQEGAGGFCGENRGLLYHCFSRGQIRRHGKGLRSGLCARQNGQLDSCFWVCSDSSQGAEHWKDWDCAVPESELADKREDLTRNWDKAFRWFVPGKGSSSEQIQLLDQMEPAAERASVVEIGTVQQLTEAAGRINSGEADSGVTYRLTADLDLGGKLWSPIGVDENTPFSGCFDGGGHTIRNFRIKAGNAVHSGFFGYISGQGEVRNLRIDCIIEGKGDYTGAMAAFSNGSILNCAARVNCGAARYSGCFVGQNTGLIRSCCVLGKMTPWLLIPWWLLPLLLALLLSVPPIVFAVTAQMTPAAEVFAPIIVDPNAKPIDPEDPSVPEPSPEDLTDSSASFVMNAEMSVSHENYAGDVGLRCPKWSTKGFVATATASGADLQKNGAAYTQDAVVYQSGLIVPNTGIDVILLSALPDGSKLPVGSYTFTVQFDFYDPETNERSSVNSTAPLEVTVH